MHRSASLLSLKLKNRLLVRNPSIRLVSSFIMKSRTLTHTSVIDAEPGNRPQRPKPKRLAAAKYRAPGTEDLDNEIDPLSNSQRTSERPSRTTKPGTYRDEHRKDLLALVTNVR